MRIAFVGAVEGSAQALQAICAAGHRPVLIVTLPQDQAGAHSDFFDLGPLAEANAIPLCRAARTDDEACLAAIRNAAPDLVLIIGWSQLVGAELRALPSLGVLGFHPSALPRMRGRGVIPWHILTEQRRGGATLFWIAEGIDDGPVAAQAVFDINPDHITARALYDRAVSEMVAMLPPLLDRLRAGDRPATPQDEAEATICARRRPQDGQIDWTRPAACIDRLIRAVGPPYPGAVTRMADGTAVRVSRARLHPRQGYFIGLPGQVQQVAGNVVTVMCGDGACIDLLDLNGRAPPRHSILGVCDGVS
ncbi:methionyl-tRNA formyltransferase [Paracoccus sp. T5]|uniref:methionyl-tRNA formyltransferase n=1 Tax=Paracoccus sp. T5 TaxID=3402161 RepID=UPI003AE9F355